MWKIYKGTRIVIGTSLSAIGTGMEIAHVKAQTVIADLPSEVNRVSKLVNSCYHFYVDYYYHYADYYSSFLLLLSVL